MTPGDRFFAALGPRALREGMLAWVPGTGSVAPCRVRVLTRAPFPGGRCVLSGGTYRDAPESIDFDDAATRGAALEALRDFAGEPTLHMVPADFNGPAGWHVRRRTPAGMGLDYLRSGGGWWDSPASPSPTEAECLAAAAEALAARRGRRP